MRKRKMILRGLLLLTIILGITSCKFGDDDKEAEIVENPLDEMQYYIVGIVSDSKETLLDGVEVSVGDNKTITANGGQYSLTVTSSGTQHVTFKKDGMRAYTTQAQFASDKNHSQTILNITLATTENFSKGEEVTVTAQGATINAPNITDEHTAPAIIEIPAGAVSEGTKIEAVVYEKTTDINASSAAFSNIHVETTPTDITATTNYTITISNPGSTNEYFDEASMEIAKEDAPTTRVNGSSLVFSNNKYTVTFPPHTKLAGDYFLSLKFNKSTSNKTGGYNSIMYNGKTYDNTLQIENEEYSAMKNLQLTVQAKYGWTYSIEPQAALIAAGASGLLAQTIKSYISRIEGRQVYTKNEAYSASISGQSVLYFSSKQNVTEKTYAFKVKVGNVSKSVAVKLNCYNGHTISYEEKKRGDHSGGTTGNQN